MGATYGYQIRIKSPAGVLQKIVTDFSWLSYVKRENAPGLGTFELPGDHAAISLLSDMSQVEIWRKDDLVALDWYCDFYGLFRDEERQTLARPIFTARCPGQMSMLGWRAVAWAADTTDRSKFTSTASETIMKTMVDYNVTANATAANGRDRDGTISYPGTISIEADGANGNSVDWYCARDNLLESLQKLARVAGGAFDLVKTAAATWQFRWYTGQLGTDRSATVIFSLEHANMKNPRYRYNRMAERTVAIVAGQGVKADRSITVRTGTNYHATQNNIEVVVNANNEGTVGGRQAAGDSKLAELEARRVFDFEVLQTPACRYGQHYGVGDLVTARYDDIEVTQKVVQVTVGLDEAGQESITPEFETP